MKRVLAITLILCLAFAQSCFAGGTISQALKCFGNGGLCRLTATCTGSAVDGNFTSATGAAVGTTHLSTLSGYALFLMRTNPGSTAPTASYDITLTDAHGDILGGSGANRSATATESVVPKIDGTNNLWGTAPWSTSLTVGITGNSATSASTVIEFWFVKE